MQYVVLASHAHGRAEHFAEQVEFGVAQRLARLRSPLDGAVVLDQIDVIEANEAFAAQALGVIQGLGLDPKKVNPNGSGISLGHPIGASGARIVVTLLGALKARGLKKGLAALCIGGGMGVSLAVEAA